MKFMLEMLMQEILEQFMEWLVDALYLNINQLISTFPDIYCNFMNSWF